MTKARIAISMLGSAHCASNVVSPVTDVWLKYTAIFLDDAALKVYPVVEFCEVPWPAVPVEVGAAADPEELCAKIAPGKVDGADPLRLAELAIDSADIVVLDATAFDRVVEGAAAEAIVVLLAATFTEINIEIFVATVFVIVTVD